MHPAPKPGFRNYSCFNSAPRHIHLVGVKSCEDTRPKNQLEASKQLHHDLCHHLSRASAQATLHTILLDVGDVIYIPHTLEPPKELGLDTHVATKLALKLMLTLSCVPVLTCSPDALLKRLLSALITKIKHKDR
eukprot:1151070-Pelagomonas_calceolata.AAC.1